MNDRKYDHSILDAKWQKQWDESGIYHTDLHNGQKPFYNLMMFPYPSAEGLHVGNIFAFVGSDIHGRFKRMQGYDVFEPMGFDAFGIHSENFAMKLNKNPRVVIPHNIENFRRQLKRIGNMFDWRNEVNTTDPSYYKWTQWLFVKLFEAGLAKQEEASVNWCPDCKTVLANEQVIDGFCERHGETKVEQRFLKQWFFKITEYAGRLLDNLSWIDWSETTKKAQENWIGRSEGAEIDFPLQKDDSIRIRVFTTRPDTLFGATYMVLAPEHPLVDKITTAAQEQEVKQYREKTAAMDIVTRRIGDKTKSGVFTGAYAINPVHGNPIPIWIADYVLMEYGTGAIMAVPAHDERDFEFAMNYNLPVVRVIAQTDEDHNSPVKEAYTGIGTMINSGLFDGMSSEEGFRAVTTWLKEKGMADFKINYRLHDWCISRQRYWGPPIPILYCDKCGIKAVPEDQLPVTLPDLTDFLPDESGKAPLARVDSFVHTTCPYCGGKATRETDVSDTFLDSAWYFLRYPSAHDDAQPFNPEMVKKWMPVDMYIGGNEHAVLHLMYTRFLIMALKDIGILDFEEPFKKFRAHGLLIKDGAKISKSRGNIIVPDDYIDQYGVDTFRMYLMFLGNYQEGGDFSDKGIVGIRRFLDKVYAVDPAEIIREPESDPAILNIIHKTIKAVTRDIESLSYNTALARLMELVNAFRKSDRVHLDAYETFLVLLTPFAPHLCEELWQQLGHSDSIITQPWPSFDPELAKDPEIEFVVQINGKVKHRIMVSAELGREEIETMVLTESRVCELIGEKQIIKKIFVPHKLINIVIR